jgi:NADH dehydrogenase FAD-containing subunit
MDASHENRERVSHADLPRVVIIGGGFGGLYAARGLARAPVAWLLWAGIHIYSLIGFANRLLVTMQWAISFVTKRRGVRILPLAQAEMTHADPTRQTPAT